MRLPISGVVRVDGFNLRAVFLTIAKLGFIATSRFYLRLLTVSHFWLHPLDRT